MKKKTKMDWLYKFLLSAVENNMCTKCHCSTCGASEFRATLLTKLKIYNKIPNITKISKTNNNNRFISPVFKDLEKEIQSNIIDEICIELKKLTEDQLSHLEEKRRVYPVLRCLFVEFEYYADHVYSLLVGTPSGIYLKKMIEHSKSRSI